MSTSRSGLSVLIQVSLKVNGSCGSGRLCLHGQCQASLVSLHQKSAAISPHPCLLKLLCIVWGTRLLPLTTVICTFKVYFKLMFFKQNCNFTIEKQNINFILLLSSWDWISRSTDWPWTPNPPASTSLPSPRISGIWHQVRFQILKQLTQNDTYAL